MASNLYAFWFAAAALLTLLVLSTVAILLSLRLRFTILNWNARNLNARTETEHHISVSSASLPFFRLHFRIRGRFDCGLKSPLFVSSEGSADSGGSIHVPLYFPLCGILHAQGALFIRDLLGFVRVRLRDEPPRDIVVKPPLFSVPEALRVDVTSSPEPSRKQQTSDEDKYYMREYVPGDRMKDINWKASFRLNELITRVSPVSPEPSRLLRLELRPYSTHRPSPVSLMHLNYAKSWLLSFLTAVQARYPQYRFHVTAGSHQQFVEDPKDLDELGRIISGIHFQPEQRQAQVNDELFIFTTVFDTAAPAYAASRSNAKTHLFRTASGQKDVRTVHLFHPLPGTAVPMPSSWAQFVRAPFQKKIPAVAVRVNGLNMEENLKLALM